MVKTKQIPTAGVPTRSVERRLWQVACQWVWNLRFSLGKTMQGGELREIEWAPPKEAPPFFVAEETPPEEYDHGSGQRHSDEPRGKSVQRPSSCKRTARCAAQRGPASG
jgi:hypothetical protein